MTKAYAITVQPKNCKKPSVYLNLETPRWPKGGKQESFQPNSVTCLNKLQSFKEVAQQQPLETEVEEEEEEGGREESDGKPRKGRMVVAFWHGGKSAWSLHRVKNAFGTRKDLAIFHLSTPS